MCAGERGSVCVGWRSVLQGKIGSDPLTLQAAHWVPEQWGQWTDFTVNLYNDHNDRPEG